MQDQENGFRSEMAYKVIFPRLHGYTYRMRKAAEYLAAIGEKVVLVSKAGCEIVKAKK